MSDRLPEDSVGGPDDRPRHSAERELGDFTVTHEALRLVPLALVIGAVSAWVALGLLDLIGIITNLLYYGHPHVGLVSPRRTQLGALAVVIPVGGGLIVGLMARYGSERIRGHGIPEAMETILVGGSRVEPRLTVLKPVSSAVSIGTGGPFGAEGPIIMTGGALGSVFAQLFRLSAYERRALLVAGASAGMAAVFGTPVAATLLGVELLLFEFRPRSMVPVGLAAVVATILRGRFAAWHLLKAAPLFPVPPHGDFGATSVLAAAVVGVAGGALAWVLTRAVYGAEDAFKRLPIHWAWWPAIGGLVVGLGGLIDPRALGVGYDSIGDELAGRLAVGALGALLLVKLVIWAVSLGSGTSGGILAPLLMMGAAMGGLMAHVLPGGGTSTWALMGMAATLAGVTRSPFTSVVFAFELTHDTGSLLPLLMCCTVAHLMSALTLRRSILTEKVARRGFHVLREYAVDPLEALFVRDVMATEVATVPPERAAADVRAVLGASPRDRRQRLYPVIDAHGRLQGAVAWSDLVDHGTGGVPVEALVKPRRALVVSHPDETLRAVADRMATFKVTVLPVVARAGDRLEGIVTQFDLLRARERQLEEERQRQRVLRLRSVRYAPDGADGADGAGTSPNGASHDGTKPAPRPSS